MQGDIEELYNLLFAGKKFTLGFESAIDAEKFRVRLSQYKLIQEKALIAVELLNEKERPVFSFKYNEDEKTAICCFSTRKDKRQYEFVLLEEVAITPLLGLAV